VNGDTLSAEVIVVGAGSAGSAATRRLIDAGISVLLLEAGGPDSNEAIHVPARSHELWLSEEDWAYHTVPQEHAAGRSLHWPRGRVLGGSGSLNGMIQVRGAQADYDSWAYAGNDGWRWQDVFPIFLGMEDFDRGASQWHAVGGPMHIHTLWEPSPIHRAIEHAAAQVGVPRNDDYNGATQDGFSYVQLTVTDRRRVSSASGYLGPVRGNQRLALTLRARTRRLLIEDGRCVGVEFEQDGVLRRARAEAEVILAAGTIESPRLLMLSGIGPGEQLRALGIAVVADLPGVGENLHDHLLAQVICSVEQPIEDPLDGLWWAESHMFWRSRPGLAVPDLQPIFFSVPAYLDWMEGPANGITLYGGIVRPASRGSLRLSSADPDAPLHIDPRILSCEADLDALEVSTALCREMGAAAALAEWGAREIYPGPGCDDSAALRDYIRRAVVTYHHQVGTCRMGIDERSVVDPRLRVHGVDGLRVADASIMPAVTTGNTNAPSVMIGERAAAFVTGG
jgi:choline dehydrogenase